MSENVKQPYVMKDIRPNEVVFINVENKVLLSKYTREFLSFDVDTASEFITILKGLKQQLKSKPGAVKIIFIDSLTRLMQGELIAQHETFGKGFDKFDEFGSNMYRAIKKYLSSFDDILIICTGINKEIHNTITGELVKSSMDSPGNKLGSIESYFEVSLNAFNEVDEDGIKRHYFQLQPDKARDIKIGRNMFATNPNGSLVTPIIPNDLGIVIKAVLNGMGYKDFGVLSDEAQLIENEKKAKLGTLYKQPKARLGKVLIAGRSGGGKTTSLDFAILRSEQVRDGECINGKLLELL